MQSEKKIHILATILCMVTKQMPQKVSFNVYIKLKYLTVEIYLLPTSVPIPRNYSYYFYYVLQLLPLLLQLLPILLLLLLQ